MNRDRAPDNFLHEWVDKARFSPLSQTETLGYVLDSIAKFHATAGTRTASAAAPAVVFDLDSTLFDVKSRTLRIAKEFARTARGRYAEALHGFWLKLHPGAIHYTLEATAEANSFPSEARESQSYLADLKQFWRERFFAGEYLLHDTPALGARDYVRRVEDAGAHVVYLTGRDESAMGEGTKLALRHWGFPASPRTTTLAMKPRFGVDDAEFKDAFLASLRGRMAVLALFDNEPANFSVFAKNFPEASLVFRHSSCSRKPAEPVNLLYKIYDFQL